MAKIGRLVKDRIVQDVTSTLKEHPSFFITNLSGLRASDTDTLRKKLRGTNARVLMVKRTLGVRGAGSVGLEGIEQFFEGSVSLVFPGEDIVPAAKLLVDFAKDKQEKVLIRGGLIEGQVLDKKGIEHLASLPSKLQLVAELIGWIEAPITSIILTLENALGEVAWVLEEASKTRPQQSTETAPATGAPQSETP